MKVSLQHTEKEDVYTLPHGTFRIFSDFKILRMEIPEYPQKIIS